ncbi:hypothetical protein [Brevundimonas sp. Root1279]|uniref:hypothetical protein n=1 Tax=Brevundimonas sp. Root1279 TaxID=1736443 RepID=UPI0012E3DF82|nr:hypothetical protein [Brevundimonas sp. Root1279]
MGSKDKPSSAFDILLSYAFVQVWLIAVGAFWFSGRVWNSGSSVADPATDRTLRLASRGDWIYVEPWQSWFLNGGTVALALGVLLLGVLLQRWIGKAKPPAFHPMLSAAAAVAAVSFWMTAARFVVV